jgi:hypothetical protein
MRSLQILIVEVFSGLGNCLDGPFDISQHPDLEDGLHNFLGVAYVWAVSDLERWAVV